MALKLQKRSACDLTTHSSGSGGGAAVAVAVAVAVPGRPRAGDDVAVAL